MDDVVRLALRTREQLSQIAPEAIAIVALGATEQHGRRLPVATDALIISHIVERAAELLRGRVNIVLCPPMPYGFSEHHLPFGGTVSVDSETYIRLIDSIGRTLVRSGFQRVLFINGHGGNVSPGSVAVDRLTADFGSDVSFGFLSYWECITDDMLDGYRAPVPGHAGGFEESLIAGVNPELIVADDRPANDGAFSEPRRLLVADRMLGITRFPKMWELSDGVTDDGMAADPDFGRRTLESISEAVAAYVIDFDNATGS